MRGLTPPRCALSVAANTLLNSRKVSPPSSVPSASSGASSAYAEIADGSKFSWVIGEVELTKYTSALGWGLAFCRICGSTLCGIFDSKVHGVTLGTVDGDPGVQIEIHTFVGSKAAWDHIGGSAPQFKEEYPNADAAGVVK